MARPKKIIKWDSKDAPEIKLKDVQDSKEFAILKRLELSATSTHRMRTKTHARNIRVAHNLSIYEADKNEKQSEGSTQSYKRKARNQTVQRVPDGKLISPYDKNSIEAVQIDFLYKYKIIPDRMFSYLIKTFNMGWDTGNACVKTGFGRDLLGNIRPSFKLIRYNNILPDPDADSIEEAEWYIVREYVSIEVFKNLLNEDGSCNDPTYNEKALQYIVKNNTVTSTPVDRLPLADKESFTPQHGKVKLYTFMRRGDESFTTWAVDSQIPLRVVPNYDPLKDVPLHFFIPEPDPEFPLGCPPVIWTIRQQEFADALTTLAQQAMILAIYPPKSVYGNVTERDFKMIPNAIWDGGTNPNNKIEKFPVETATLQSYNALIENLSAQMAKNLNISDATHAADAEVHGYSATPQGVELQRTDRTISINQLQKAMESFYSDWVEHALRSYVNAMSGQEYILVEEETRKKIEDIETKLVEQDPSYQSVIRGDEVLFDFDILSKSRIFFEIRPGSTVENEKDKELGELRQLFVPVSQMVNGASDSGKQLIEKLAFKIIERIFELSNTSISVQGSEEIDAELLRQAVQATMEEVMQLQQQMQMMAAAQAVQQGSPEGGGEEVSAEFPPMPPPEGEPVAPVEQE